MSSATYLEVLTKVMVSVDGDPRHPGLRLLHHPDLHLLPGLPAPPLQEPDQLPRPPAPLSLVSFIIIIIDILVTCQVGRLIPRVDQAAVILHWTGGVTETQVFRQTL